jgi:hypothetical protein
MATPGTHYRTLLTRLATEHCAAAGCRAVPSLLPLIDTVESTRRQLSRYQREVQDTI